MAARLATLGALGAEGMVLFIKKRWSAAISGETVFSVSAFLNDSEKQQRVSLALSWVFFPPCSFLQILSRGGTQRKMFLCEVL